jgi:carbon starvation protein CstA
MIDDLIGKDLNMFTLIVLAIFAYYIIATVLPIDKIIGKIYPVLGLLLLLSAIGVAFGMFMYGNPIPELTLTNMHPKDLPITP